MPFLTVMPPLIGGTNFSQGATGPQYCNVGGVCGNTLANTLTVHFSEDNTVRMPGSLEETVTAVPEPASVWLWMLGMGLLLVTALLVKPFMRNASKFQPSVAALWIGMGLVSGFAIGVLLVMWP